MTISANTTATVRLTDQWQLIASSGDIQISAKGSCFWALTSSAVAPSSEVMGHPFKPTYLLRTEHEMRLEAGQYLWVRTSEVPHDACVTATDPA